MNFAASSPDIIDVPTPSEIRAWASQNNILILAHSYQEGFLQDAAHFVGDSLELARRASEEQPDAICFCGVHFMAETAKILCPNARVFVPDIEAGCSLAESCQSEDLQRYQEHLTKKLGRKPVTISYVNCTASVKALSDIICTSGNAERVVRSVSEQEPILFVPDMHLGGWLNEKTGREMILWNGSCEVHELFSVETLLDAQGQHPESITLAHPECPKRIRDASHHVLGTAGMLELVKSYSDATFIVATEGNMIHRFKKEAPSNHYVPAPGASCACNLCPHMQKNTPEKLWASMQLQGPEVVVDKGLADLAREALNRMLSVV